MKFSSISKVNGKVVQDSSGREIVIHGPSVIRLKVSPEKVARYERRGEDLVLVLSDGEEVLIKNFFVRYSSDGEQLVSDSDSGHAGTEEAVAADEEVLRNDLLLEDENGVLWWGQYPEEWTEFHFTEIEWNDAGFAAWPWLLGALAGVGGVALAAGGKKNAPPIAVDDRATGEEDDGPISGNVLGNDSDPDNDPLTVTGFSVNGKNASAGDTIVIDNVGTITIKSNGDYVFTPAPNYHGNVPPIHYTISDGNKQANATLNITVTPVVDLVADHDSNETNEDTPVSGTVADNDSTTSGGTLTFEKATDPANGTVVMNPDGSYTYTPNRNYHGTDSFTYTVTDPASGETLTKTVTIEINPVDDLDAQDDEGETDEDTPFTSSVADNDSTTSGGTLTFEKATDPANGIVVMNPDGSYTYTPNPNYHGTDSFTYTVTDPASGEEATKTVTIVVNPVVDLTAVDDNNSTDEDTPVTGTVATNDSTTSGGTLTFEKATDPANGTVVMNPDGSYTYTPDRNFNGKDRFTYTVTDADSGETLTKTVTIVVNPVVDLTAADDNNSTNEDTPVNGTVADNDSTTSGGTLTFVKATDPANGTVTMNPDGSYTYTPNANFNGTDRFTYTVTDPASGESATKTVTIVVNPVADLTAADDNNSTDEDTPVTGTVATNDSTTSGGTLTFAKATDPANGTVTMNPDGSYTYTPNANYHGTDRFTYTVTDADSGETLTKTVTIVVNPVVDLTAADDNNSTDEDTPVTGTVATNDSTTSDGTLTFETATDPANGTVVMNPDGSYTYTPDRNFNGTDRFTYTVTDADSGETLTKTVTIVVNPVVDLTAADDNNSTNEDTPVTGTVATNDSTTSGGTLTFEKATDPANGTVVMNPDGSYTYTPNANFNGKDRFTYTVTDADSGETLTKTVTIVVNPVVDLTAADDNNSTNEDTPVNGTVATNDSTTSDGTLTFAKATDPANGTVVMNPDGSYTYTPNANFNGTDRFTYTVTDPASGESATKTVTIVVNPVVDLTAADDNNSTDEDTPVTGTVATNDSTTSDGTLTFVKATDPANGTVVMNPDGSYTYTPNANFNGTDRFTYTVTDPASGESATKTVTIVVNPVADLTAADDTNSTDEDTPVTGTVATNDSTTSGGTLTFAKATDPANGTVTMNPDGSYTYTPNANYHGTDRFTYTVTDPASGESATKTVTIVVNPVVDLTAADDNNITNQNTPVDGTVADNDSTTSDGTLTFEKATDPLNGTVVMNPDGSYTYTPNPNFKGTDRFTYTVTDPASGESATKSVTIVVNGVPVIVEADAVADVVEAALQSDGAINEGVPTVSGSFSATDSDGDTLSWSAVNPDTNYGTFSVDSVTGAWTFVLNNSLDAVQALIQDEVVDLVFTVQVSDGRGGSDQRTVTITITGSNDAPTAVDDTDSVTESGVAKVGDEGNTAVPGTSVATGNVLANDIDVDAGETDTLTVVPQTITGIYGDLVLNADGSYIYTLDNSREATQALKPGDVPPTEEFTYVVRDVNNATGTGKLTITVNGTNDRPVINVAGSELTGSVTEQGDANPTADTTVSGTMAATDVDLGDTKTWTIATTQGTYGSIAINPSTGQWIYTIDNSLPATQALNAGDSLPETFIVRVTDGFGGYDEQTITITVNGSNDLATGLGDQEITLNEDATATGSIQDYIDDVDDTVVVTGFSIDADGDSLPEDYDPGDIVSIFDASGNALGTVTMGVDGSYSFTPEPNYSGPVPVLTYTVSEGAGFDPITQTLTFVITPVSDAPRLAVDKTVETTEDNSVVLGLVAPVITDTGAGTSSGVVDRTEHLGAITLTVGGDGADGVTFDMGGTALTPVDGVLTIVLTNGTHVNGLPPHNPDGGVYHMTTAEYLALKAVPAAESGKNFTVTVDVTSYEVDGSGNILPNVEGASSSQTITVDVQAVTDGATLTKKPLEPLNPVINEDDSYTLSDKLTVALGDSDGNSGPDADGSETYWYEITGLPVGSTITIDGVKTVITTADQVVTSDISTSHTPPTMAFTPPPHYSGELGAITVTLKSQDTDADSDGTTDITSSSVEFMLDVMPIADDVRVGAVTTDEDTAVKFLANVTVTDTNGGGEEVINAISFTVPTDWILTAPAVSDGWSYDDTGDPVTISFNDNPDAGTVLSQEDREAILGEFTILPPPHSSLDETITLTITTTDKAMINGAEVVDSKTADHDLEIIVTPVGERTDSDSDDKDGFDVTMADSHVYDVAGKEDQWFALGSNYKDAANPDGGFDDLGADGVWTNSDADEFTYAVLTPELTSTNSDDSVIGTTFRFSTDGGTTWHTRVYDGTPVWIPAQYLDTLQVKLPADVSGTLNIGVQAGTVDFDDDFEKNFSAEQKQNLLLNPPVQYGDPAPGETLGDLSSSNPNAAVNVSGSEDLTMIEFDPVADDVTMALNGRASGLEDTEIPLSIHTKTSDPSETIDVTIDNIPVGATITYVVAGSSPVTFTASEGNQSLIIRDFDNSAKLTITPPLHSNADFTLNVSAVSKDGDSILQTPVSRDILVQVQGVADQTTVVLSNSGPVTEEALDSGDNKIALSGFVTTVTSPDKDGSETLTLRITGLDARFSIEGATLVTGGTGTERVWSIPVDPKYDPTDPDQSNPFDSIFVVLPPNFSGKVSMEVAGVSTENDGDSLTGSRLPDSKPLIVTKDVIPSIDSTITTSFVLTEDTISPVDLKIVHQNGDTDEVLTEVYIPVNYATADYQLYLGSNTLASSGLTVIKIGGVDYYVISAAQLPTLGAKAATNLDGDVLDLQIKYKVTDPATLGPLDPGTAIKDATLDFTVTPVTDPVELDIADIDLDPAKGSITPPVAGDDSSRFTVNVTKSGTVTVTINATSDDNDGSEQVTRVLIQDVPEGVTINGASMIGSGEWLLILPAQDPSNPNANMIIDGNGQSIDLEFVVGIGTSAGLSDIKITVQTQDRGTADVQEDEINFKLDVNLGDGGEFALPSIDEWKFTPVRDKEDTRFALDQVIDGKVTLNDTGAKHLLAITLTDLPDGTKVEYGPDGQLVEVQRTFVADPASPTGGGKYVWTIAVEVPVGGNGQSVLDQMLQDIRITPPANSNDNQADFTLDAQLKVVVIGGPSVTGDAKGEVPITPVTDTPVLSITTSDVDEGSDSIRAVITGGPSANDNGNAAIVGDKVYVKVTATGNTGGAVSKIVLVDDGEGNMVETEVPLVLQNVTGVAGVPDGQYYVIDNASTSLPVTLEYSPPADGKLALGNVVFDAIIQSKESGASNTETTTANGKSEVKLANNGTTITIADATGNEAVLADKTNAIQLTGLSVELNDSSELIKAIMLTGVPVGFLIYTGNTAADATLAGQASNAGGSGTTNTWILAANGQLPPFIAILPPAHWSGTIEDLMLIVASGETALKDTKYDSSDPFTLTIASRPDGITIAPTNSFGVEGTPILLNLNAAMVDNAAAVAPVEDSSIETTTLQIKGLGEYAAFYVDNLLYGSVTYDADMDVYTITGLTQAQLDKLAVVQSANSITDQNSILAGVQVDITAWTVETATGEASEKVKDSLNLAVTPVLATTGDDKFIWGDHAINGKAGIDTVSLRWGEDVSHNDLAAKLKNIEKIDLSVGGTNRISGGLTLEDVVSITGKNNGVLTIMGNNDDFVTLSSGSNWIKTGTVQDGYVVYTSGNATLLIDQDILAANITIV